MDGPEAYAQTFPGIAINRGKSREITDLHPPRTRCLMRPLKGGALGGWRDGAQPRCPQLRRGRPGTSGSGTVRQPRGTPPRTGAGTSRHSRDPQRRSPDTSAVVSSTPQGLRPQSTPNRQKLLRPPHAPPPAAVGHGSYDPEGNEMHPGPHRSRRSSTVPYALMHKTRGHKHNIPRRHAARGLGAPRTPTRRPPLPHAIPRPARRGRARAPRPAGQGLTAAPGTRTRPPQPPPSASRARPPRRRRPPRPPRPPRW